MDVVTQRERVERKRVNENTPALGDGRGGGAGYGIGEGLARRYQKAEPKDARVFRKGRSSGAQCRPAECA